MDLVGHHHARAPPTHSTRASSQLTTPTAASSPVRAVAVQPRTRAVPLPERAPRPWRVNMCKKYEREARGSSENLPSQITGVHRSNTNFLWGPA